MSCRLLGKDNFIENVYIVLSCVNKQRSVNIEFELMQILEYIHRVKAK